MNRNKSHQPSILCAAIKLVGRISFQNFAAIAFTVLVHFQGFAQCVEISTAPDTELFCPGQEITLTATSGFETYTWYYNFSNENSGGTLYSETTDNSLTLNASEWAVTYWYVETNDPECAEPSTPVVWDSWIFAPIAISHDPNTMLCPADSSLIESAFNGPSNFQWYQDFLPIEGATESQYWVTEPGYYTLQASYPQCPNYWLSSGVGPEFNEYVVELPEISAQTIDGEVILFIESGSNIQWYIDGTAIEDANELNYTAVETGVYTVTVVDDNGCTLESEGFILEALSDGHTYMDDAMDAYPNPFSDYLQIKTAQPTHLINYKLFSLTGKLLKSGSCTAQTEYIIRDLNNLKSGLYLLELSPNNGTSKKLKLVKE